ncbi:MAG TPA: LysR family transcriptional regulator, partial [Clostridiaceae bacterium]|nr:LysR family transcriptional regulator [Clostridiaceae bacterium]
PLLIETATIPMIANATTDSGLQGALIDAGITKHYVPVLDDGCILYLTKMPSLDTIFNKLSLISVQPIAKIMLASSYIFLGPGPAQLLQLIEETGSVREASSRMNISYSKAWNILNTIREQTGFEAVLRQQGGATGGSAQLSQKGKDLLERYISFERRCQDAIEKIYIDVFESKHE